MPSSKYNQFSFTELFVGCHFEIASWQLRTVRFSVFLVFGAVAEIYGDAHHTSYIFNFYRGLSRQYRFDATIQMLTANTLGFSATCSVPLLHYIL